MNKRTIPGFFCLSVNDGMGEKKRKKVVSPTDKRNSVNGSFQSHSRVHRNPTEKLRGRKQMEEQKSKKKRKGKGERGRREWRRKGGEGLQMRHAWHLCSFCLSHGFTFGADAVCNYLPFVTTRKGDWGREINYSCCVFYRHRITKPRERWNEVTEPQAFSLSCF